MINTRLHWALGHWSLRKASRPGTDHRGGMHEFIAEVLYAILSECFNGSEESFITNEAELTCIHKMHQSM